MEAKTTSLLMGLWKAVDVQYVTRMKQIPTREKEDAIRSSMLK